MLPSIFGKNLFDDFFGTPFNEEFFRGTPQLYKKSSQLMNTDILESDNGFELHIDLPGFKKEDIKLSADGGYLTVSAEHSENNDEKDDNGKYIRRERYSGSCSRSFYVGEDLKKEDIKAKFDNGILSITLPKQEKQLPEKKDTYIAIE